MLDQSKFPGDLKTNLLKKIERIDKPNVEVMLNILRLYQKNKGCNSGPKPTVNNINTTLVTLVARRTIVKRIWVAANVW